MTTVYPPIKVEVFLTHGSVLAQEKREGRVKRRTQSNTHTMSRDFWSVACVCVCVCVCVCDPCTHNSQVEEYKNGGGLRLVSHRV